MLKGVKGLFWFILIDLVLMVIGVAVWFWSDGAFQRKQANHEIALFNVSPRDGTDRIIRHMKRKGYRAFVSRSDADIRFLSLGLFGSEMIIVGTENKLPAPSILIFPLPTAHKDKAIIGQTCDKVSQQLQAKYGDAWISYGLSDKYKLWFYQSPEDRDSLRMSLLAYATPKIEGACYPVILYSYGDFSSLIPEDFSLENRKRILAILFSAEGYFHLSALKGNPIEESFITITNLLQTSFSSQAWSGMQQNARPF